MCGINGVLSLKPIDLNSFNVSRDTLSHRGPDGFGTELLNKGKVALGHRRLSIIDLSHKGHQPMTNEESTIWLTYNGEVYNYLTLRRELLEAGHLFKSETDSEVIIHGYEEWGIERLLNRLNGMYAFALWDNNKKCLIVARDRLGIKPLCYKQDADSFVFGSEIKSIISYTGKPNLNYQSILDYLYYRHIPEDNSVWQGVKKLQPGNYMKIYLGDKIMSETKQYWALEINEVSLKERDIIERADEILTNSVISHMQADVDVGLLLSGGMDSTLIAQKCSSNNLRIKSHCIGFENFDQSEHLDARAIANYYGLEHSEEIIGKDSLDILDYLNHYFDDLYSYSTKIPYYLATSFNSELKVALAGDGGDEVFSGYRWHNEYYKQNNAFESIVERIFKPKHETTGILNWYAKWHTDNYDFNKLLNSEVFSLNCQKTKNWLHRKHLRTDLTPIKAIQWLDIHIFLRAALMRADTCSMANSVEVRVPFLDHELVQFMLSIPEKQYFKIVRKKYILSKILEGKSPPLTFAKPKKGFSSPLKLILHKNLIIKQLLTQDSMLRKNGIIVEKSSEFMSTLNFNQIFSLWNLNSWLKVWN
ncbi:MAG: asparagine synthase (glutamine-hydrolyzing) [Cyclobacteriaceae bacterium]